MTNQSAVEQKRRRDLVVASPGLQPYGTYEEIQELIRRFKVMLPETEQLKDEEIAALAQIAYVHGLNPLPAVREIMWIPGKGAHVGIRGLRRKGREWAAELGLGMPDIASTLLTDAVEREQQDIPTGALTYKTTGGFPTQRAKWADDAKKLRDALGPDAPYEVILDTIGPRPSFTGYGYVSKEEMERRNAPSWWHACPQKSSGGRRKLIGMEPCPDCGMISTAQILFSNAALAMKRSEAHWWKQAADLPFAIKPGGEGLADLEDLPVVIEGQILDTQEPLDLDPEIMADLKSPEHIQEYMDMKVNERERQKEAKTKSPEEIADAGQKGTDTLFGPGDTRKRTWSAPFVQSVMEAWMKAGVVDNLAPIPRVVAIMNLSPLYEDAPIERWALWGLNYRGLREAGKSVYQAADGATAMLKEQEGVK